MPTEDFVRISVQLDLDWLPGANAVELWLLEVCQYPHLGWHEDEQRLAGLQERAELDRLPRDSSIFRRIDLRVGEIELGLSHSGLGLFDIRAGRLDLRLLDRDLLTGRVGLAQLTGGLPAPVQGPPLLRVCFPLLASSTAPTFPPSPTPPSH